MSILNRFGMFSLFSLVSVNAFGVNDDRAVECHWMCEAVKEVNVRVYENSYSDVKWEKSSALVGVRVNDYISSKKLDKKIYFKNIVGVKKGRQEEHSPFSTGININFFVEESSCQPSSTTLTVEAITPTNLMIRKFNCPLNNLDGCVDLAFLRVADELILGYMFPTAVGKINN